MWRVNIISSSSSGGISVVILFIQLICCQMPETFSAPNTIAGIDYSQLLFVDDGGDAATYDYKPLSPELINYYTQYLLESNYTSNDFIDYADLLQELSENAGVKASTPKKLDLSKYGIRRENVDRTIPRDNYPTQQLNLSYNM